ncbi:MAG: ATP-binding cassette domain-containing protein [Anaerolineaceae bacterium]|nr:ATP-binding cassette domain-containing protein [Anaerolineaceae bacterium]
MNPVAQVNDRYLIGMLSHFLRPFWKELVLIFLMLIGVTLLSLLPPYLTQRAVDGPIQNKDLQGLVPYGVVYLLAVIGLFILRFAHTFLLQNVGQNALVDLRQALFEHILQQDMRFFNTTPVGQLVSRMSNDIEALTELLSTSIVIVASNLVTLIGIILVMLAINWQLALLGLAVLPIMTVCTVYIRRKIRHQSDLFHGVVAEYLAFINEQFGGMLVVQLFGRQEVSRREFETINRRYRDVHMRIRDYYTIYASVLQLLTTVGLALVLYGGGQGVLAGWATLGMLISFIQYARRTFEPIMQLSEQFTQIQTAFSAGERIARMLKVEPEIVEDSTPIDIKTFKQAIQFDHVIFGYEPTSPVLKDISIDIRPGQKIAIVGATGAGKTSLAGLLARFYDVQQGSILIDGVDIRKLPLDHLRDYVSVVPQSPYCFNGTIADNLKLFDPSVTQEQMETAAKTACAAQFIEQLPGRYEYMLLPGGANLSQGQRQLLALARALIHSPKSILVLDEATSSVDTETEALIQEGLANVLQGRTSLIIAHRLSTIRDADRILVMQQGKVVEDGDHKTLLARNGLYAQLYHRQFADADITPQQPVSE